MLPDFRRSIAFWKVPRIRQFVLVLKSYVQMNMCMEYWWNDIDRGKPK
jgi:hypothetical protein